MEALSFDGFVSEIQQIFADLPDPRHYSPNQHYAMKDAALGAFAMFFSQSPSFLAFQNALEQTQGRNNARSLFGIEEIPSDNQIRNMLDPVAPELFYPVFEKTLTHLQESKCLDSYRFFEDHLLVTLDGTQYFRSAKINCPNCTQTKHRNGKVSYSHTVRHNLSAPPISGPEDRGKTRTRRNLAGPRRDHPDRSADDNADQFLWQFGAPSGQRRAEQLAADSSPASRG